MHAVFKRIKCPQHAYERINESLGGTQYPISLGSGSEECQKDQTT